MYKFTEDCLIGITEIDEEHRRLFTLINEAISLTQCKAESKLVLRKLLAELKEYAATHFAHEEAYMEKMGDPELSRQRREHAQFTEKIESLSITEQSKEENMKMVSDLLSFMAKWLYRHILGSDTLIGKMNGQQEEDPFAFSDKYKTGISLIDEEHKHLFEIIRETRDLIDEQFLYDKYDPIIQILKELKEYTILHFGDEEEYMESIGYEGLELQKIAHTAFVDRLNEVNLDDLEDSQKEYLDELLLFLLNWLTNHILKMDKQIPAK